MKPAIPKHHQPAKPVRDAPVGFLHYAVSESDSAKTLTLSIMFGFHIESSNLLDCYTVSPQN